MTRPLSVRNGIYQPPAKEVQFSQGGQRQGRVCTALLTGRLLPAFAPGFIYPSAGIFKLLIFCGIVAAGDSPQFSALNAHNAPKHLVDSALTIVNCIGFSITIINIELINYFSTIILPQFVFLPLAFGPALGLIAMAPLLRTQEA